ncbi:MAG: amino acid ABC transporter permease [bacterium]|nr:amino acid ABC transporter permease [bacterium]
MEKIFNSFYNSVIYDDRYKYIFEGLFHTILIALFAVIIGIIIGTVIAIIRNNYEVNKKFRVLNSISKMYVDIIRGTPVILQLMIIYYVIFKSVNINILIVGVIAFGINSGAYVSEIIRAGINSIDKGQMEAGLSLGLKYSEVMRLIILPQAIRNILPALGNEFITLLKETSVGAYIGIVELTKASDIIASRTYDYFFPLIIIAIIYLIMTLGLSKLVNVMERRLNNARN